MLIMLAGPDLFILKISSMTVTYVYQFFTHTHTQSLTNNHSMLFPSNGNKYDKKIKITHNKSYQITFHK